MRSPKVAIKRIGGELRRWLRVLLLVSNLQQFGSESTKLFSMSTAVRESASDSECTDKSFM